MNKGKTWIGIVLIVPLILLTGCDRGEKALLDDLLGVEEGGKENANIDELKSAIERLKGEVERTVEAGIQLVNYYKMVAQQYMGKELYGLAAEFYRKSLDLEPSNSLVAYRLGICTSQIARSQPNDEDKLRMMEEALNYYRYAVEFDPENADALYAAAVLCIFELDREADAEGYLDKLLAIEPDNIKGMFLLARVDADFGRIDDAIALYDRIIRESSDQDEIGQAKANRAALSGVLNGG